LFRRGRIDEQVLDQQLDLIENETATLQEHIDSASRALSIPDRAAQLESAAKLLQDLRLLHEQSISPELQRRLIEILVESIEARTVERWGVPHSEIVIRYRFSPPQEGAALLWSRTHHLDNRNAAPEQLHTLGDHLRRRRLTLKLPQEEAAKQLGVGRASLHHWEQDRQKPGAASLPAIVKFLGYNPLPVPNHGLDSCRACTAQDLLQNQAHASECRDLHHGDLSGNPIEPFRASPSVRSLHRREFVPFSTRAPTVGWPESPPVSRRCESSDSALRARSS
jgi:transcriptional regulator with XRE-family HTH domain